jgi:hypothetical protein
VAVGGHHLGGIVSSQSGRWVLGRAAERGHPEIRTVLGEQDGPPEKGLKARLSDLFRTSVGVTEAYLVRLVYQGREAVEVALALKSFRLDEPSVVEAIQRVFGEMFRNGQHLDVVFLGPEDEGVVRAAARPFYNRS